MDSSAVTLLVIVNDSNKDNNNFIPDKVLKKDLFVKQLAMYYAGLFLFVLLLRLWVRRFAMKKTSKKKPNKKKSIPTMRPHSAIMLDGPDRAPSRAMLYPTGFKAGDFKKPIIGVASTWSNVTPCNMHIDELAKQAEVGTNKAGGKAIVFNTITISDGISMGTEGMKYSMVSREVIADSIETVVGCECMPYLFWVLYQAAFFTFWLISK